MLLENYQQQERFWMTTLFGATTKSDLQAFRGEFTVLEGELNAVAGKRTPPRALLKQAVLLATADKLLMVAGSFESVDELPEFISLFKDDLDPSCVPVIFIENLAESCQIDAEGNRYVLIQYREGAVWNEVSEFYYIDKHDLKGLSSEDKVLKLYEAGKEYQPKFPVKTLEEVLATKTNAKREGFGAV
ncbi:hypothetical protein Thi970DRAFT_01818 [Thiorhodovibrio frisius]|uniref:Uncharacterized protein n=2 Tax=Thiorhodovibrio frisius TaxID=631362 RepID=H8Z2E7_9GAMM|nr:hypothetical protein [Thiorhodovibrio frisius]EIC21602.1 hypothetical protein Thi970DRAFT_01818 [Thiorhodovibrio frisius]WPL21569.1 hypothetical protein Thiofri_01695 [Thiorhodovibrio frisius]